MTDLFDRRIETLAKAFLRRHWVALGYFMSVTILFFLLHKLSPGNAPLIEPDSETYINFSPWRTAGYPAFLWLIRNMGLSLNAVVISQIALFAIALEYLYHTLDSHLRPRWLIFAALIAVSLNPAIIQFHFSIMTESLFITALLWFLSGMIGVLTRPSWRHFLILSIATGGAIVVRPVGYSLVPVLAIAAAAAIWNDRDRSIALGLAAIVPLSLLILASAGISSAVHGKAQTSLAPQQLFSKSMLVSAGPSPYLLNDPRAAMWAFAEARGALPRTYLDQAPEVVRQQLLGPYENFFANPFFHQAILPAAKLASANGAATPQTVVLDVALDRLMAAPIGYAAIAWEDFYGLWTPLGGSADAKAVNAYLARHPAPVLGDKQHPVRFNSPITGARHIAQILGWTFRSIGALALLAAILGVAVIGSKNPAYQGIKIAGMSGLAVHGNFLLVALTALRTARYTMAMWPAIVVCLVWLYVPSRRAVLRLTQRNQSA